MSNAFKVIVYMLRLMSRSPKNNSLTRRKNLAAKVQEDWDRAPAAQKHTYQKLDESGPDGQAVYKVKEENGVKVPANRPMSAGQLTGSGTKLQYNFVAQSKPVGNGVQSAEGKQLIHKTTQTQTKKNFPGLEEYPSRIAAVQERLTHIEDNICQLNQKCKDSDPTERAKLNSQRETLKIEKIAVTKEVKELTAKRRIAEEKSGHKNGAKCAECKILDKSAERGDDLNGAWHVAYGTRPGQVDSAWGPQKACSEKDGKGSKMFGCAELQHDNKIEDLHATAQKLEAHRADPDKFPKPEEAELCKRGSPNCVYKAKGKTSASKSTTPKSGKGAKDRANIQVGKLPPSPNPAKSGGLFKSMSQKLSPGSKRKAASVSVPAVAEQKPNPSGSLLSSMRQKLFSSSTSKSKLSSTRKDSLAAAPVAKAPIKSRTSTGKASGTLLKTASNLVASFSKTGSRKHARSFEVLGLSF